MKKSYLESTLKYYTCHLKKTRNILKLLHLQYLLLYIVGNTPIIESTVQNKAELLSNFCYRKL